MGKLTLLFVLAAILGGSVLAYSTRSLAGLTAQDQSESQADLLARQIAETGQNLALTAMMGPDGFVDPSIGERPYDGGRFAVAYDGADNRQTATVTVRGYYGGATHTIESNYQFDPMNFPGPIWIDVPYATSSVTGNPSVTGGTENLPVRFDSRMHTDLDLNRDLPLSGIVSDLGADMRRAGSTLSVPAASAWAPNGALLEDLNVEDAEGLYQTAVASMTSSDRTLPGNLRVSGTRSWPGATTVTRIGGSLTVPSGSAVAGEGVLLVEGGLVVEPGGRLTWTGLVVVRAEQQVLPVTLQGHVSISGALVVKQQAMPPGGHLDVTVWRDRNGLTQPKGSHQVAPWTTGGPFPWTQHNHRFDLLHADSRTVYFLENGSAGRHENEMQFRAALADAGSTPVYLEFLNQSEHGYARYTLGVQGNRPLTGMVRSGFPAGSHAANNPFRTTVFAANTLRDFVVDVQSLRSLRDRFDNVGGCDQWPFCIGESFSRGGALRVRLVRASDNRALHESAFYWHMQTSEVAEHEAEMKAWRDAILAGTGFGTHLTLGPTTNVAFALAPIIRLADKLDFDGNEMLLLSTTTEHETAAEGRAATAPALPSPTTPSVPQIPPTCTDPDALIAICNHGTSDRLVKCSSVAGHLSHGCLLGTCAANGICLDSDDDCDD